MKDVKDFRTMMRTILGDASARRYSDETLDMGLMQALRTFRAYQPLRDRIRMKVSSSYPGMVTLNSGLAPDEDLFSVRCAKDGKLLNALPELFGEKLSLRIRPDSDTPKVGDSLDLEIGLGWKIKDLDNAQTTTLPEAYFLLTSEGGAGYAAHIRARSVTEVFGKRPEDIRTLMNQADGLIDAFLVSLRKISSLDAFFRDPWPEKGFSL